MVASSTTSSIAEHRINRRSLLKAGGGGLAALALMKAPGLGSAPEVASAATAGTVPGPLAWVWRFKEDGSPEAIRSLLAAHGLGVLLKVTDGVSWMAKYDKTSPMPISGPESVAAAAQFFESGGVPFHAWAVVNGHDPFYEAQLASQVLDAGARTLTFDLELPEGTNYWQTGPTEARILGEELRRLQPNAYISVAPDARPWQVKKLPMAEFAAFCNDICPQTYWHTFDTPANHRLLAEHGFPVGPDGLTPELIVDATMASLQRFGKPVRPVGQGASNAGWWGRFTAHAASLGMSNLSTWRVGTTAADVWPVLSATDTTRVAAAPPEPEPEVIEVQQPAPEAAPNASQPPATIETAKSESPKPSSSDIASGSTSTKEATSTRTTSETSSSREMPSMTTTSSRRLEWHDRVADRVKALGIGGGR